MAKEKVEGTLLEESSHVPLVLLGNIPSWLSGTLVRNGPINIKVNGKQNEHWFDGLAMLHSFSFKHSKIVYSNRFLRTDPYKSVFEKGSIDYIGFAIDPCVSLFRHLFTLFLPWEPYLQNANINVAKIADDYAALTEVPLPVRFDPLTLETLGVLNYPDSLPKYRSWESAHPHVDRSSGDLINYLIEYGFTNHYIVYRIRKGSAERETIARIPVKEPAYMHSFSVTENFIILTEYPFVVRTWDMLVSREAFIHNFRWEPQMGTRFLVIDKRSGELREEYSAKPFFSFHHVNAFEEEEDIFLDMICYDNPNIVLGVANYFRDMEKRKKRIDGHNYPNRLERFILSSQDGNVRSQVLLEKSIELPRINPAFDGRPYLYSYFVDPSEGSPNESRPLYKFDNSTQHVWTWAQDGCFPGEPVFVEEPLARWEDQGIVLSVVMDLYKKSSFLLILDAASFKEIGRAEVPHLIPPGLHGAFF